MSEQESTNDDDGLNQIIWISGLVGIVFTITLLVITVTTLSSLLKSKDQQGQGQDESQANKRQTCCCHCSARSLKQIKFCSGLKKSPEFFRRCFHRKIHPTDAVRLVDTESSEPSVRGSVPSLYRTIDFSLQTQIKKPGNFNPNALNLAEWSESVFKFS